MIEKSDKLIQIFSQITSAKEINLETAIDELDLDSLDILDVLTRIRKEFDKEIDLNDFVGCKTISSVLAYLS